MVGVSSSLGVVGPRMVAFMCALLAVSRGFCGNDVKVNSDPTGDVQNEVRIAVDPTNFSNIVTAYNDLAGSTPPTPIGISFSTDGGMTWQDNQLSVPTNPNPPVVFPGGSLDVIFDPMISVAPGGDFYAGYIATENVQGGTSGLFIERSTDGGMTWSGPTTISLDGPAVPGPVPDPNYRFNDRPHSVTDGNGNTHVAWIKDVGVGQPTSDIYYSVSGPPGPPVPVLNPTGLSFTTPVTVNDNPNGFDMANAPSVAAHAASGNVYVAWIDVDVTMADEPSATIFIDRTTTPPGPGPFPPPVFGMDMTVATIDPLPKHLSTSLAMPGVPDDARAGSYPVIAVDPLDATGQTVYLAFAAEVTGTPDEGDIFFTKSTDGGVNWAQPFRVNDDTTTYDQMHPAIAVKPDGTIDLIWYDKRNSTNDDAWDVYFANSIDGGNTFGSNLLVTDSTFATPFDQILFEPWLGEYLGLTTAGNLGLIAFAGAESGNSPTRSDIFFDSLVNPSGAVVPEPSDGEIWMLTLVIVVLAGRQVVQRREHPQA